MVAGSFFLKLAVRYLEQQDPLSLVKLVDALDSYSGDMTATFYKPFSLSIVCEAITGCLSVV